MGCRAFLTWEFGAGRGHIVHLAAVAAALRRRGWALSAALVHLDHAAEISSFCRAVHQAPTLPSADDGRSKSFYGDWLAFHGYDDANVIRGAVRAWRALMENDQPDVVVAEQSPSAILASRTLGIPVVRVGVPATTPPTTPTEFPPFLDDHEERLCREDRLLDAVNEAIADFGLRPFAALPEFQRANDDVVASVSLLDRYDAWRTTPRVPPVIGGWSEPGERQRKEVFVYLSTRDRFDPVILTAISSLDLPMRVVIAGKLPQIAALANLRRTIVEERPRTPAEIARTARVLVHAGNHGLSCLGLRSGLPHVTLSRHAEHIFDGRQLAQAGVGIGLGWDNWTVPKVQAAIREAWENDAMSDRARALEQELAPEFAGDPGEMTADRIEAVVH